MSKAWRPDVQTLVVGKGIVGHIARDPGDGRWLWSVTWAGASDTWDGSTLIPGRPRRERHGKAANRDAAIDCVSLAVVEGRPDA